MNKELFATLKATHVSRLTTPDVWDAYPYHGSKRNFDKSKATEQKP